MNNTKILRSIYTLSISRSSLLNSMRKLCDAVNESPRIPIEKSINRVTLLGRVGSTPQLRGTETNPVVVFPVATNTNYKRDSGIQQKTDWHRVSVFEPNLRRSVLDYLKKGNRVYLEGKLLYGEFTDANGVVHFTTTIVAKDIIFIGTGRRDTIEESEDKDEAFR